jgi:NAD(P) transhydrogenase subunit alpha
MLKKVTLVVLALLLWTPVCMAKKTAPDGVEQATAQVDKAKASADKAESGATAKGGNLTLIALFVVFILACFLGVELINKVPPKLHTPLMSGSNAMSGITIVGALMMANLVKGSTISIAGLECDLAAILGTLALICATINVVGGFLVTDRMLKMFKKGN